MNFRNPARILFVLAAILVSADHAWAQGSCSNCSAVDSNLTLTATAETAVTLTINTGSGGAAVSDDGSGAFSVSFGNVNGLGVGAAAAGVSVSTSGSGATYTTPITVTPAFSGFTSTTATVKVYQDSGASADSQSAAREGGSAGGVASVPTVAGSATTVSASAASGSGITRYVGVFVSNANGGGKVVGSLAPKFIYTVTVN
ncbi:MAG TPA: hypothetical protein VF668_00215 [Pyrinomonadaceae bacterium]|jgi:hypothetical protein